MNLFEGYEGFMKKGEHTKNSVLLCILIKKTENQVTYSNLNADLKLSFQKC